MQWAEESPRPTTIGPGFIRLHLMKRIGLFDILLQHNDLAAIEDWADLAQDDLDFLEYVNEQ